VQVGCDRTVKYVRAEEVGCRGDSGVRRDRMRGERQARSPLVCCPLFYSPLLSGHSVRG
jgi:hypothetical protein